MYKYCTYKFYGADKRRIAAFAEEAGEGKLKVYLFYCSTKDSFSRKKAKELYAEHKAGLGSSNPVVVTIAIDPSKPQKEFISFMYTNFFVLKDVVRRFSQEVLVNKTVGMVLDKSAPKRYTTKLEA